MNKLIEIEISFERLQKFASVLKIKSNETILKSIFTDSRKQIKNSWFLCLQGDRFDGHSFITKLNKETIAGVIYSDSSFAKHLSHSYIQVTNTLEFLHELSTAWREIVNPLVIGITGSNGKTSTKEMLAQILSQASQENVFKTQANFNNQFGVAYTLLQMPVNTSIAIIEMGSNSPGEIKQLTNISKPDIAIITSISAGHIGNFSDILSIAKEKSSIVHSMQDKDLFVNENIDFKDIIIQNVEDVHATLHTVPLHKYTQQIELAWEHSYFVYHNKKFRLNYTGMHSLENLNLIIGVVNFMSEKIKLDIDTGLSSLNNFNTLDGRSKCITIQNYYIYDDCYNANLQSFKKAIEFCSSQTKLGHCYGFFGEMAELGEDSFDYHQELIKYALQLGFKKIYFSIKSVRLLARLKALSIDEVTLFGNENNVLTEQVNSFVETNSHKSAVVLVKGSRSAKMERVIKQFETSLKINF